MTANSASLSYSEAWFSSKEIVSGKATIVRVATVAVATDIRVLYLTG
jgi:hypothetical protein